jgi:hypothetical protein
MRPFLNEWMFSHDVKEVLKLRLSDRVHDVQIAWFYERTRIFTVKSAYKLSVDTDQDAQAQTSSSTHTDGSISMYREIRSTNVPAKVHIFAWRLAQDGFATQLNRRKRKL